MSYNNHYSGTQSTPYYGEDENRHPYDNKHSVQNGNAGKRRISTAKELYEQRKNYGVNVAQQGEVSLYYVEVIRVW